MGLAAAKKLDTALGAGDKERAVAERLGAVAITALADHGVEHFEKIGAGRHADMAEFA